MLDSRSRSFAVLAVFLFATIATAQTDTVWVRRLSGTGNGDDQVRVITSDLARNVYAAIQSRPDSSSAITIAKYSPAGGLLWTRRFEGRGYVVPVDIAVSGAGDVYVTGNSGFPGEELDIVTLKYTVSGDSCWDRYFDGREEDVAVAVMTDNAGNAYVAGTVMGDSTYEDLGLLKYSGSGELLWSRTHDRDLSEDFAHAATISDAGYIYLAGMTDSENVTGYDFYLLKYTLGGSLLWARSFLGTGPNDDSAVAVALDPQGNPVVVGQTVRDHDRDSSGMLTVKFSPTGDTLWSRVVLGGYRGNSAVAVGSDALGDVVVAGTIREAYQVVKYSSGGTELWRRSYHGPDERDSLTAMIVTPSGDVYVTGRSESDRSGGGEDIATLKYSSAGESLWARRWTTPDSVDATGLTLIPLGSGVCVGGWCDHKERYQNGVLVRYDAAGIEQWVRQLSSPGRSDDRGSDVAFDTDGNVVVTGYLEVTNEYRDIVTARYSPAGGLLWSRTYGNIPHGDDKGVAVQTDSEGNVYTTGYSESEGTGLDYVTLKYDPEGNRLWAKRYDGPAHGDDEPVGLAVDRSGNVVVTGESHGIGTDQDFATVKYSGSGQEQWVRRHNGSADATDYVGGAVVDSTGAVYVAGTTREASGKFPATIVKYDGDGTVLWVLRFEDPDPQPNGFLVKAVDLGQDGNVYVGGNGGYKFLAACIAPEGETLWVCGAPVETTFNFGVYSASVDRRGRFYVCGDVWDDYLTVGFSPGGEELWRQSYGDPDRGEWAYDIVAATSNRVFVTGRATICYDSSGTQVWIDSLGDFCSGVGYAIAAGSGGRVAVTGYSYFQFDLDVLVVCYAPRIGLAETSRLPCASRDLSVSVHPNPFVGLVCFQARIPSPGQVVLEVYDRAGRLVGLLREEAGRDMRLELTWSGADAGGRQVPNGVYFAQMTWIPERSQSGNSVRSCRTKFVRLR